MNPPTVSGLDLAIAVAGSLIFISLAAERLVEVIKGWWPSLNVAQDDPVAEGRRKSKLNLLAMAAGTATVWIAYDALKQMQGLAWLNEAQGWNKGLAIVALGMLSSGGSSLWNSLLSYLLILKNVKCAELENLRAETGQKQLGLSPVASATPRPPVRATAG